MRVIDSSSLVKFFSREKGWDAIERLILEGLVSLELSTKEVASALWKKTLSGQMRSEDAKEILEDLVRSDTIELHNQSQYLIGAFKIATKEKITIYDALFIQLAKNVKAELVTSDNRQAEAARHERVKVMVM